MRGFYRRGAPWLIGAVAVLGLIFVVAIAKGIGRSIADRALGPRVGTRIDETLARVARELNRETPSMIDQETRLDSVIATANRLAYFYTIPAEIRPDWRTLVTPRICGGMPTLLRSGAVIEYRYHSADGRELGRHEVVSLDCAGN